MRLFVDQIRDSGLLLEGDEQASELTRRFARLMGEELMFIRPLHYRMRALKVDDLVEVEGSLSTVFELSCSRCLGSFSQPLDSDFTVTFTREEKFASPVDNDEGMELSAEELGLSLYSGDEIDLHETLYEQILLSIPPKPLCARSCKGLCPHCGADLNRGACQCDPEPFNGKFSALKNFKPNE